MPPLKYEWCRSRLYQTNKQDIRKSALVMQKGYVLKYFDTHKKVQYTRFGTTIVDYVSLKMIFTETSLKYELTFCQFTLEREVECRQNTRRLHRTM